MSSKPLIGINADYRPTRKEGSALSFVAAGYYTAIERSGGIPIILPPMEINRALVEKVALLARLEIPAADADRVASQLGKIVGMVEKLNAVDTKGIEPLTNPGGLADVFRDDEPRPCLPREEALANAPDKVEMFLRVPRVVE